MLSYLRINPIKMRIFIKVYALAIFGEIRVRGIRQLVSHCQQRRVCTKLRGWLYMTDVLNHVGSNPACMLWHTSVTANVPALLRVRAHARVLQYGNVYTYARDNFDSSTLEISTACKRIKRSTLFLRTVRESGVVVDW